MPVSFIELYISFTLSAWGGFYSIFQNAVCKKQEPAWGAVYILAWKKRQPVHIIFWEVMKCHGKCMKWMCFYVLILEIKLGIIFAVLFKGPCRSLHPCVSCVTAVTCFHSEVMLIIFARIKALSPFSVSIGTHWGWKSLKFWFSAFVSLIKNKGIMDKKKQFHLIFSSQQVFLFAWISLHFIKLYFCLGLQHHFSRRAHCSPFCNNMCFLISLVFTKWA